MRGSSSVGEHYAEDVGVACSIHASLIKMKIKTLDDIEREKYYEKREKLKKEISEDISEVIDNVFGNKRKENKGVGYFFIRVFVFLILGLILINVILGNIWLLKFFIKEFFKIDFGF